jgi:hypothetical protein
MPINHPDVAEPSECLKVDGQSILAAIDDAFYRDPDINEFGMLLTDGPVSLEDARQVLDICALSRGRARRAQAILLTILALCLSAHVCPFVMFLTCCVHAGRRARRCRRYNCGRWMRGIDAAQDCRCVLEPPSAAAVRRQRNQDRRCDARLVARALFGAQDAPGNARYAAGRC